MNTKFKIISSVLIILLSILLIAIVVAYFNKPIEVIGDNPYVPTNHESDKASGDKEEKIITQDTPSDSGESNDITEESGESGETILSSGEEVIENVIKESDAKNPTTPVSPKPVEPVTPVIITSEDTMTNKEKREILTELDDALMELLDDSDGIDDDE